MFNILNAVEFNNPIKNVDDDFFTDFSGLRKGFNERKIFRMLNINPNNRECNSLTSIQRVFLSGHRGTGKTTELLKLRNEINETKCFLTVFCDVGNEELDINNIDFVDIVIFMLEQLVKKLNDSDIKINQNDIESFYSWYSQRIEKINVKTDASASIEIEAEAGISIPSLFKLITKTKNKLSASQDTKDTIRRVFTNKFSDFSLKFNEFILKIKETIKKENVAQDLLFIIDGFEKIGTLEDRKKILIDNSNKFVEIQSNMIIALPIELFSQIATLSNFATPISFPLITLDDKGMVKFKEFIDKRINVKLFDSETTIQQIIKYGAGSPRETLKIIREAYMAAEGEVIDSQSVIDAKDKISNEVVNFLNAQELEVLKEIDIKENIPYSDTVASLYVKKVLLEYGDGTTQQINPIILENDNYKKLIEQQ
ncbi:MAG: hypothetical protein ACI9TV_001338 [Sulfurimonas sp.]|jgi:hypothetical protein|uniref:hypothetical protein n=1 Tax=Sulfurimonas sp. TaxID=2022749 RepID=UPI0039E4B1EB